LVTPGGGVETCTSAYRYLLSLGGGVGEAANRISAIHRTGVQR
jgi:hypothetical protein